MEKGRIRISVLVAAIAENLFEEVKTIHLRKKCWFNVCSPLIVAIYGNHGSYQSHRLIDEYDTRCRLLLRLLERIRTGLP